MSNIRNIRRFFRPGGKSGRFALENGLPVERTGGGNKYHARACEYDGRRFASQKERDRYIFLKDCERRGLISNLRCQVRYDLFPDEYEETVVHLKTKDKTVRRRVYVGVDYTPDFVYDKDGETVVEDVKGDKSATSRDFILRLKMMHYLKGIDVRVVYNVTEPV